ncbi:hypothetical protein CRG98_020629, partial [Punica granatum]
MGSELRPRKKNLKRKRTHPGVEPESIDSLPWSSALPGEADDPAFSLFTGSNELDGGFLSLEEIDEAEYGLAIPTAGEQKPMRTGVFKEKKHTGGVEGESDEAAEGKQEEKVKSKKKKKKEKKKKEKQKTTTMEEENNEESIESAQDVNGTAD